MALINKLTAIGDAIRAKTGKTDLFTLDQMVSEIGNIQTGKADPEFKLTDNLYDSTTIVNNKCMNINNGTFDDSTQYFLTSYIPVEAGANYIIKENQTATLASDSSSLIRIYAFKSDKSWLKNLYQEKRTQTRQYKHPIEIPSNGAYIRVQFQMNADKDIEIYKVRNPITSKNAILWYRDKNSYTQGMCVSDDYVFVSYSPSKNTDPNDYCIRKFNKSTRTLVNSGTTTYNHLNGMTYNNLTNKIIACALNGNSKITTSTSNDDFCLYIINPETLALEEKKDLKSIVIGICAESVGISGVAYNKEEDEYYILTRYPQRQIIVLNSSFEYKRNFFMMNTSQEKGVRGDITTDGVYIYSPVWRNDFDLTGGSYSMQDEVEIYTISGEYVSTFTASGISHIEGMDYCVENGVEKFYINYIDFYDTEGYYAKTVVMDGIYNIPSSMTIPTDISLENTETYYYLVNNEKFKTQDGNYYTVGGNE